MDLERILIKYTSGQPARAVIPIRFASLYPHVHEKDLPYAGWDWARLKIEVEVHRRIGAIRITSLDRSLYAMREMYENNETLWMVL